MRPLTKGLAQAPQARHLAASLWFEYVRLLGTPTVLSIAVAAVLHGCYCELSDQPTHWGTALLVVALSLGMSLAFWRTPQTLGWASACGILVIAWLLNSRDSDVCEVHQGFLATLSVMCLGTVVASAMSRSSAGVVRMAPQDGPPSTMEAAIDTPSDAQHDDGETQSVSIDQDRPGRDPKPARGKWLIACLVLGIFFVYMIVVPVVAMLWEMWTPRPAMRRELTEMSLAEYLRLHTVAGVIMAMFLAMGASVGSFLNVVIFRLPRGRALLWPPSACAACRSRIAGRDNIPILAWLNLSGKCRNCGVAISVRYPVVETLVAAVFVLFFYRELLSGGENLPVRTSNVYRGIVWILFYTKWDLLTLYVFHMFVLTCVFSWGMINLDRFRVPKHALLGGLLSVVGLIALAPHLNPLLANGPAAGNRLAAVNSSLLGLGLGGLVGFLLAQLFKLPKVEALEACVSQSPLPDQLAIFDDQVANDQVLNEQRVNEQAGSDLYGRRAAAPASATDAAGALALLGAACGYQAALCIGLATAVLALGLLILKQAACSWRAIRTVQSLPVTLILFGVAVVHLTFWNSIHGAFPRAGLSWLAAGEIPLNSFWLWIRTTCTRYA